jgi:hypothetical protein
MKHYLKKNSPFNSTNTVFGKKQEYMPVRYDLQCYWQMPFFFLEI